MQISVRAALAVEGILHSLALVGQAGSTRAVLFLEMLLIDQSKARQTPPTMQAGGF